MSTSDLYPVSVQELREERYERLNHLMAEAGLDAIVAFSSATPGQWGNLRFVTNYRPFTRYGAAVYNQDAPPILFVPYVVHTAWARSLTWVEDIRGPSDFIVGIGRGLQEIGHERGRIGLTGATLLPSGLSEKLRDVLAEATLEPIDDLFGDMRCFKSDLDLAMMRYSASMADKAFQEIIASLRSNPNQTEREIFSLAQYTLSQLGAETSLILISSGPQEAMPIASPRSLQKGDLIQISMEPVGPGGYWTQTIRMISLGEPAEEARRAVEACCKVIEVAREELAAGRPMGGVAKTMAGILSEAGSLGIVPFGHGAGLDLSEPPSLSPFSQQPLEARTALVMHPSLIVQGQNYFLGDTFEFDGASLSRLSSTAEDLVII